MASSKKRSKKQRSCKPYPFELRLRAVKLYLEEGYSKKLIEEELGIGNSTIGKWAKKYKQLGEEGLRPKLRMYG
jgi:transposase